MLRSSRTHGAGHLARALLLAMACAGALPVAAAAQEQAPDAVLTIDQDRLYAESRFGQKMLADIDTEVRALQAENRTIEAGLEAEEKSLTDRRPTLSAEEFRSLADAFDAKVKGIRSARDAKARDLALKRDEARQTFLKTAIPLLAQIMSEKGASAIIDRSAIVLSFDRIDITDLAIERVDALLPASGTPDAPATPVPGAPVAPAPADGAGAPAPVPADND